MEQKPVPSAIPEVTLLHGPKGGEAVFRVFIVAMLDGGGGLVDAVVGEGVELVHVAESLARHEDLEEVVGPDLLIGLMLDKLVECLPGGFAVRAFVAR